MSCLRHSCPFDFEPCPKPLQLPLFSVPTVAQASLERIDQKTLDLYQIHWPGFPIVNSWANDAFCRGLVDCQKQGLAKAVGVSNYNVNRLQRAHGVMQVTSACLSELSSHSISDRCSSQCLPIILKSVQLGLNMVTQPYEEGV